MTDPEARLRIIGMARALADDAVRDDADARGLIRRTRQLLALIEGELQPGSEGRAVRLSSVVSSTSEEADT